MKSTIAVACTVLIFASCSAVKMVPLDYSVERPGEVVAGIANPDTEMFVEHLSMENGQLIFDFQIRNNEMEMIRIQPEEIRVFGAHVPFPEPVPGQSEIVSAILHSPDQGARAMTEFQLNRFFKRKIRAARTAQVALMLASVAIAVNEAANEVKDSKKEYWTPQDENRAARRQVLGFTGIMTADLVGGILEEQSIKASEDLKYLPEEYLYPQLIFPQGSARGKVFFKYSRHFDYYRIIVPHNGLNYIFDFRKPVSSERRKLRRIG